MSIKSEMTSLIHQCDNVMDVMLWILLEDDVMDLIGGGPQGSLIGQLTYIVASDDAAEEISDDDKFKYIDDLEVLDLIYLAGILIDYEFYQHVASDIGIEQKFLPPSTFKMQETNNNLTNWTKYNQMELNEEKCNYMIFTRSQTEFVTRLSINDKIIDQVPVINLLGVWISEDLSWSRNCKEISKKAYSRINMLSKLKYVGASIEDLINLYMLFIRSTTEYCSTAFHTSLTTEQSRKLENIQKVCLKVILGDNYISYEAALEMTGLKTLFQRRQDRCLKYGLKALKHPQNSKMFPVSSVENVYDVRNKEKYHVNFAATESYKRSAIPSIQRMLNEHV